MCSSILWMLALTGPSSITCLQILAMKRASLVPPLVDSSVVDAGLVADGLPARRSTSSPGVRQEGQAADGPGQRVVEAVRVEHRCTRCCSDSGVDSVEKRKLKSTTASPGITLLAPVPAWMLLICQLVGWK